MMCHFSLFSFSNLLRVSEIVKDLWRGTCFWQMNNLYITSLIHLPGNLCIFLSFLSCTDISFGAALILHDHPISPDIQVRALMLSLLDLASCWYWKEMYAVNVLSNSIKQYWNLSNLIISESIHSVLIKKWRTCYKMDTLLIIIPLIYWWDTDADVDVIW